MTGLGEFTRGLDCPRMAVSVGAQKTTQVHCTNQVTRTTFPVFLRDSI